MKVFKSYAVISSMHIAMLYLAMLLGGLVVCEATSGEVDREGLSRAFFYEAESIMATYTTVEMDMSASSRMYVMASRNDRYSPLASVALPEALASVTVWARIRGCSQELKTNLNGQALDLKWHYQVPSEWTWVNFGTYERSELGASIRIVRAPGGEGGIDALFLDTTGSLNPNELENIKLYEIK